MNLFRFLKPSFFYDFLMNLALGQNDCYLHYIWEEPLRVTAELTEMVRDLTELNVDDGNVTACDMACLFIVNTNNTSHHHVSMPRRATPPPQTTPAASKRPRPPNKRMRRQQSTNDDQGPTNDCHRLTRPATPTTTGKQRRANDFQRPRKTTTPRPQRHE